MTIRVNGRNYSRKDESREAEERHQRQWATHRRGSRAAAGWTASSRAGGKDGHPIGYIQRREDQEAQNSPATGEQILLKRMKSTIGSFVVGLARFWRLPSNV